jgi:hypothetical protein
MDITATGHIGHPVAPDILGITGTDIYWKIQGTKAPADTGTNTEEPRIKQRKCG